jgi:hypothetical protein
MWRSIGFRGGHVSVVMDDDRDLFTTRVIHAYCYKGDGRGLAVSHLRKWWEGVDKVER